MKSKKYGRLVLFIIIAATLGYKYLILDKPVKLRGYVSGDKIQLLQNKKVQSILEKEYGLQLAFESVGSLEMADPRIAGTTDFIWPAGRVALEYHNNRGTGPVESEVIFNSALVLYSWDIVADALVDKGILAKKERVYSIVNLDRLLDLSLTGTYWQEIGLPQLHGGITISSAAPTHANSGRMFAGLAADTFNGGAVMDEEAVDSFLPRFKALFRDHLSMPYITSDLFEHFIETGVGNKPLIVGYENQIIEFFKLYPGRWAEIKDRIRILYPEPTIWVTHPVIVLTPEARALVKALMDPEIQKIAREFHGFRTGLTASKKPPGLPRDMRIPENITSIIPMPAKPVMDKITRTIREKK